MANLMQVGFNKLTALMSAHASDQIRYVRGLDTVEIPAVQGFTDHELNDLDGGFTSVRTTDWLVEIQLLNFGAGLIIPQRGDVILHLVDPQRTFVVVNPGGQNCYKAIDYETRFRIHTEQVNPRV